MAGERLLALAVADVPQLGGRIAGARHEGATVRRQRQRHHVAGVAHEAGRLLAGLDVPQAARHVARAGHDLPSAERNRSVFYWHGVACIQLGRRRKKTGTNFRATVGRFHDNNEIANLFV